MFWTFRQNNTDSRKDCSLRFDSSSRCLKYSGILWLLAQKHINDNWLCLSWSSPLGGRGEVSQKPFPRPKHPNLWADRLHKFNNALASQAYCFMSWGYQETVSEISCVRLWVFWGLIVILFQFFENWFWPILASFSCRFGLAKQNRVPSNFSLGNLDRN